MFFHIDESGNTGNNLFDPHQPRLSYGLLSSSTNVDVLGKNIHQKMLQVIGEKTLHANVLGVDKLTQIAPLLLQLQKKMKFDFDYFYIDKPSYALVIFFDAVFDAGLNDAVKWDAYWTPLRFLMICNLTTLFDEPLLKEAWSLCISKSIGQQERRIVALLTELVSRAKASDLDHRSKEIMIDAFRFGLANPLGLDFGVPDQKIISPNAVCFQFVVGAMATRLRKRKLKDARSIVLDRQSEFNQAQIGTHYNYARIAEALKQDNSVEKQLYLTHPLYSTLSEEFVLRKGTPNKEMTIANSKNHIGLQIADVYLWIVNRILSQAEISRELRELASSFLARSLGDGISIESMAHRWDKFESHLPSLESLTTDQVVLANASIDAHRSKVKSLRL